MAAYDSGAQDKSNLHATFPPSAGNPIVLISPETDPQLSFAGRDFLATCRSRIPLQVEGILSRTYTERQPDPSGVGWRPVKMQMVDLQIKNISNRRIVAMTYQIKDKYVHEHWQDDWTIDNENPRASTKELKPGERRILSVLRPELFISPSVAVNLAEVRYDDGEIQDFSYCPLGRTESFLELNPEFTSVASVNPTHSSDCASALSPGIYIFPPRVLRSVAPTPPPEAPKGITVIVRFCVDATGRPQNLRTITSGGPLLDSVATAATQQYLFVPAVDQGVPIAVTIDSAFKF